MAQDIASSNSSEAPNVSVHLAAGEDAKIAQLNSLQPDVPADETVAQSLNFEQPAQAVFVFLQKQLQQIPKAIEPLDAVIATANKKLSTWLMYDFGTSQLPLFGAADIQRQPVLEYFKATKQFKENECEAFYKNLADACSKFKEEHDAGPLSVRDVELAVGDAALCLPAAPSGTAYVFDVESQSLMIEPRGVSVPFIACWLLLGSLALTLRMKLINIRGLLHAVPLAFGRYGESSFAGELSKVKAFTTSMASTIGLGSITAVALAVGMAGPGAAFWIMVCGILGMSLKFTECSLAQFFRRVNADGTIIGGPMRSMSSGFKQVRVLGFSFALFGRFLGMVFAWICLVAAMFVGSAFQVNQSLKSLQVAPGLELLKSEPWIYGLAMACLVGLIVFGSVRWLGTVTQVLTPLALLLYLAACTWVIGTNLPQAQVVLSAIFTDAFKPQTAVLGGLAGFVVLGVTQATFSTDAGLGTSAIVHAAARCDEPTREGLLAMLETFIVGVVLVLLTALTIGVTGVATDDSGQLMVANSEGSALLMSAFAVGMPAVLTYLLHGALWLFAFSACIAWAFIGERCITYLFGANYSLPYKFTFLAFTFLGSVVATNNLMTFSQLLLLTLAIPNLIAMFFLHGIVAEELDDYWRRLRSGKFKRNPV